MTDEFETPRFPFDMGALNNKILEDSNARYEEGIKRRRTVLVLVLMTAACIIIATAIGGLARYSYLSRFADEQTIVVISSFAVLLAIFGLVGIISASAIYLNIIPFKQVASDQSSAHIKSIRKELYEVRELVKANLRPNSSVDISAEVNRVFCDEIKDNLNSIFRDAFLSTARKELATEYGPSIEREQSLVFIASLCSRMLTDLKVQIETQQRNANFNVLFGMIFSTAGLFAMGLFVYTSSAAYGLAASQDWTQFGISSLPKLSFVIIFESIAFFFFRAYREDRSMVRYMRNEATNVESRLIGMNTALLFGGSDAVSKSIDQLMKTERNFIIRKGERVIVDPASIENSFLIEKIAQDAASKVMVMKKDTATE